ncbi:MAG: 4-alpha-glucanotransferase [Gammaproteobacteria bacterium]|nr:4-alpha-glucanotransferase [Gammaproteobacteria bacterium]
MPTPDLQLRRAGILLHPTSLPSGQLDSDVERWLNILFDTGFSIWQVLPLGEPQAGLSPYQCSSAFAFNPALLTDIPASNESDNGFIAFCNNQQYWLDDYALFKVLKQNFNDSAWIDWPDQWKFRDPAVLQHTAQLYKETLLELKWQQYQLHKRWQEIRLKASELDILLFGDMPIYIGHDSADVWAHRELFILDSSGNMEVVSGVPPDYFSDTGQRWGNPHYDWETMHKDDYTWWIKRMHHHLELFDLVRIDHFRGLEAAWMIDATCETAVDGHWQKIPGDELLSAIKMSLKNNHGQLPFVAEDLGVITPEVTALRKKYHLPGMSILQFGFDEFEDNPHKPQNIEEDNVVYTGTHDNDTTKGWFNNLEAGVKNHVLRTLNLPELDERENDDRLADHQRCWDNGVEVADQVVEKMVDNAMFSRAYICIIPVQDCFHLDSSARMNIPGTNTGNWQWQFQWSLIEQNHDSGHIEKIRLRNQKADRLIKPTD